MAQERKANNAQNTLSSAITAGATSLTVVSASSFPTNPQFRIKINNELLLVTAVSGTTFTITRGIEGTTAAAHGNSDTVTLVETQAGQVRHLRDWTNPLLEVGRPMQLLDASGNTLTASSFTDVNMTNGTKTDQTGGAILLEHNTQGAVNDYAIIKKASPTAPWTFRVGFIPNLLNETGDFPSAGPVLRESSTGELYAFRILARDLGTTVDVVKLTTPTASSTAFLSFLDWTHPGIVWMEIEDNNTNVIFKLSADGVNFITIGQESRTAFMAGGPDEIGFAVNNFGNGAIKAHATLVSWAEF